MASDLCYLCGKMGADTSDHVVPKTCYVPPLPADVITLPTHRACNKSTSKDEEWVTIGWATSRPFPDNGDPRYDKSKRALLRDQAEGLRQKYLASLTPHRSGGAIIDLGEGRVEYVLAKIVKGLLFKQEGMLISQDHTWSIKKVSLALVVEQEFTQMVDRNCVHHSKRLLDGTARHESCELARVKGPSVRLDLLWLHSKPDRERRECVGVRLLHLPAFDARYLLRADPVEILTA